MPGLADRPHKCPTERLPSSGLTLAHYPQAGFSHDSLAGLAANLSLWHSCSSLAVVHSITGPAFVWSISSGQVHNLSTKTRSIPILCESCPALASCLLPRVQGLPCLRLGKKRAMGKEEAHPSIPPFLSRTMFPHFPACQLAPLGFSFVPQLLQFSHILKSLLPGKCSKHPAKSLTPDEKSRSLFHKVQNTGCLLKMKTGAPLPPS